MKIFNIITKGTFKTPDYRHLLYEAREMKSGFFLPYRNPQAVALLQAKPTPDLFIDGDTPTLAQLGEERLLVPFKFVHIHLM